MKFSDLANFYDWMKERDKGSTRPKHRHEYDPFEAIYDLQDSVVRWKKFLEDLEKINKKEEKKGWDAYTFGQKLILMTAIVPFIVVMQLMLPTILLIHILGLHQ